MDRMDIVGQNGEQLWEREGQNLLRGDDSEMGVEDMARTIKANCLEIDFGGAIVAVRCPGKVINGMNINKLLTYGHRIFACYKLFKDYPVRPKHSSWGRGPRPSWGPAPS